MDNLFQDDDFDEFSGIESDEEYISEHMTETDESISYTNCTFTGKDGESECIVLSKAKKNCQCNIYKTRLHLIDIDQDNEKKKPHIILLYNETKGGVDPLDYLINATNEHISRRMYLRELRKSLCHNHNCYLFKKGQDFIYVIAMLKEHFKYAFHVISLFPKIMQIIFVKNVLKTTPRTKVCCSYEQFELIYDNMNKLEWLFYRCPEMTKNFINYICKLTCDPNMGKYLIVTKTEKKCVKSVTLEIKKADAINFHKSIKDINFMFNNKVFSYLVDTRTDIDKAYHDVPYFFKHMGLLEKNPFMYVSLLMHRNDSMKFISKPCKGMCNCNNCKDSCV
ncbi:hypothetical protein A3Q56_03038 [Intoshia linei]|uniref:Niemann-Pick C1 N-terminal domain-containing protein n=1 Tax=Intoshia linei TaxID=1819745 RepID=A0A177B4Q4_9BILA|nr:hypothetical protein A3Q56_03038 [Intoshia linei]